MQFMFLTSILLSHVAVYSVSGTVIHALKLGNTTCPYKIYHVSEHDSVQVEWDGIQLPSDCKMSFTGRDVTGEADSHEVCVRAWKYNVNDCNFTMKFFNGQGSVVAAREYSCQDELPPKFCADEDKYLDLEFEATSSSSSNIILSVTANAQKNMNVVYVVVAIAVIGCIAVVGVILFIVYWKRKQHQDQGIILQQSNSS